MEGVDDQPCEYELQRERRIARNQEVMREMGLLDIAAQLTALGQARKQRSASGLAKRKTASERGPLRQSLRLQHISPQIAEDSAAAPRKAPLPRQQSTRGDAACSSDQHNLFRIRTMSQAALQRRIHKIQRCDKLSSFAAMLEAEGWSELAAEAEAALVHLKMHS